MYFPFLRGKQNELLAINEVLPRLVQHARIVPVLEPVKSNTSQLLTKCGGYAQAGLQFVIVENPQVGELVNQTAAARSVTSSLTTSIPGWIVHEETSQADLSGFFQVHASRDVALVHRDDQLVQNLLGLIQNHGRAVYNVFEVPSQAFAGSFRAKLEDGFRRVQNNAQYPPESRFSDLFATYQSHGFDGFGDYSIIGTEYFDTGGPPYAIAIHLTHDLAANQIRCRHFVSDSNQDQSDQAGKFMEAVGKLDTFVQSHPGRFDYSTGVAEFQSLYQRQHHPGLGVIKKLSMRHHLELMMTLV